MKYEFKQRIYVFILIICAGIFIPIDARSRGGCCRRRYRDCAPRGISVYAVPPAYYGPGGPYPMANWDPFFFNGYPYTYPYSYYYPTPGYSFGFNVGI